MCVLHINKEMTFGGNLGSYFSRTTGFKSGYRCVRHVTSVSDKQGCGKVCTGVCVCLLGGQDGQVRPGK